MSAYQFSFQPSKLSTVVGLGEIGFVIDTRVGREASEEGVNDVGIISIKVS